MATSSTAAGEGILHLAEQGFHVRKSALCRAAGDGKAMPAARQGDYQVIHRAPTYTQCRELAQQQRHSSFVDK